METRSLIYFANQRISFYMTGKSIMKELNKCGKLLAIEETLKTLKWISQYIQQAVHTNFADTFVSMKNVIKR